MLSVLAGTLWLGTGLEDQVQRRLGRAPEATEARLLEHRPQARLSGLRAEPEPDLLRERVRACTPRSMPCTEAPPSGCPEDSHHGRRARTARPAAPCRPGSRCSSAYPAIPTGSPMSCRQSKKQIKSYVPGYSFAPATSNVARSSDASLTCPVARRLDRRSVVVEPPETRGRVRVGHRHHRGAVAAADIRDPRTHAELVLDSI